MIYNDEKQLIGLFDTITLTSSQSMLIMHPSITTAVYDNLSKKLTHLSHSIKPIYFNDFSIISKSVALQHIFNVFSPIAEPLENGPMNTLQASNFDDTLFSENQVVVFNVNRRQLLNKNFRINERIFRADHAATSKLEGEE